MAGLGRAEFFFWGGWSGPGRGFRRWPDVEKGFCRLFTLSSYLTNGRENEQWSSAKDLAVVVGANDGGCAAVGLQACEREREPAGSLESTTTPVSKTHRVGQANVRHTGLCCPGC